jgi:hypothetical protein
LILLRIDLVEFLRLVKIFEEKIKTYKEIAGTGVS